MVNEANQLLEANNYTKAKNRVLDAATQCLEESKTVEGTEKLSLEYLTKNLIELAREYKIMAELESSPLPRVPGSEIDRKISEKSAEPDTQVEQGDDYEEEGEDDHEEEERSQISDDSSIQSDEVDDEIISKDVTTDPIAIDNNLIQFIVVNEGGSPFFTLENKPVSKKLQIKIDEILFSGAITAISQLFQEVMRKPIQRINFEDEAILIKNDEDFSYVFVVRNVNKDLEDLLDDLADQFTNFLSEELLEKIAQGQPQTENEELRKDVSNFLGLTLDG